MDSISDSIIDNPFHRHIIGYMKDWFESLGNNPCGIYILSGPTGSGKITIAKKAVELLRSQGKHATRIDLLTDFDYQNAVTAVAMGVTVFATIHTNMHSLDRKFEQELFCGIKDKIKGIVFSETYRSNEARTVNQYLIENYFSIQSYSLEDVLPGYLFATYIK